MATIVRMDAKEILRHFKQLEDPRSSVNRLHPLDSVIPSHYAKGREQSAGSREQGAGIWQVKLKSQGAKRSVEIGTASVLACALPLIWWRFLPVGAAKVNRLRQRNPRDLGSMPHSGRLVVLASRLPNISRSAEAGGTPAPQTGGEPKSFANYCREARAIQAAFE